MYKAVSKIMAPMMAPTPDNKNVGITFCIDESFVVIIFKHVPIAVTIDISAMFLLIKFLIKI